MSVLALEIDRRPNLVAGGAANGEGLAVICSRDQGWRTLLHRVCRS
jgi:hypothetical protein